MKKVLEMPDWLINEKALFRYIMTYCTDCPKSYYVSGAECKKCREGMEKVVEEWKKMKSTKQQNVVRVFCVVNVLTIFTNQKIIL